MHRLEKFNPAVAVVAVVVLIAAALLLVVRGGNQKTITADFPRAIALYVGSDVKILGVTVGKVDSVTPDGTDVAVKFHYDGKYKVPKGVKAAVISPSIVGDRFIQLTPAYTGGAQLENNAHLGTDRTATPLELDQIFGSINDLDQALGPEGANKPDASGTGALTRLLDSTAKNFGGEGVQFNQTLKNLGKLTKTLSDNKDQLFGTVNEVEKFTNALSSNDQTVRKFNDSLASGASLLASERQDLAAVLQNLSVALTQVRSFVAENKNALTTNIKGLNQITKLFVKNRAALEESLKDAPEALNNLALAYDEKASTLDTRAAIGQSATQLVEKPSVLLCALVPDACKPLTSILSVLGLGRTAALTPGASSTPVHVVEPIDKSLGGLVAVN